MQTNPLESIGRAAKAASWQLAALGSAQKNALLHTLATLLEENQNKIIQANTKDMQEAKNTDMAEHMLDRLLLTPERVQGMANDVRHVASLTDPVGKLLSGSTLDNGIRLNRVCVPLGVVAAVYEARPNVTTDIASLCLKTGNAVILRGGKETFNSNIVLLEVLHKALQKHALPLETVQAVTNPDRTLVSALLELDEYVDMLIPRGGAGLQRFCSENSRIPVITGGIGVCHIFVDASANIEKSLRVIENAKVQRPSVCNSVETVLVHAGIAIDFVPRMAEYLGKLGVTLHPTPDAEPLLQQSRFRIAPLAEGDLDKEWLTLDLNVEVVNGLDEAIGFIRTHSSGHSDAILTENMANANRFVQAVDSSSVYVNASTRFTDGGQFGLGAEVAISTQKLHARGPMGLDALTTYKWVAVGDYTVRE